MGSRWLGLVVDSSDPARLARWWAEVLGYRVTFEDPGLVAIAGDDKTHPGIAFVPVPEAKAGKNRLHLDVNAGGGRETPEDERTARVDAVVEDLVAHGATKVEDRTKMGERWVVMLDPEGNEFCVQ